MERVQMEKTHSLVPAMINTLEGIVQVNTLQKVFVINNINLKYVPLKLSYRFFYWILNYHRQFCPTEINPVCADVVCQNGGSCLYINETHNATCVCGEGFYGQLCEGKNVYMKSTILSKNVSRHNIRMIT